MVSLDMVNQALTVQKAIKDVPALASILQEADDLLLSNSPFFQITNLAALVKKIKNPADLRWTMELMLDCIVQQPDLIWTIRTLAPKGGEVGIIDQCVFKHHLKTELLSKVMEDIDLDPEEKKTNQRLLVISGHNEIDAWLQDRHQEQQGARQTCAVLDRRV